LFKNSFFDSFCFQLEEKNVTTRTIPITIENRIDRIASIPEEYLSETPPPPLSIKFGLERVCNFNCEFCYTRDPRDGFEGGRGGYVMPFEDRLVVLQKIADAGIREIGLFLWGEPFTDKHLTETIRTAKETFGFERVFITTNGSLAVPEKVFNCIALGLDSLKFSIFAKDGNELASIAHVKPNLFKRTMDNIRAAVVIRDELEKRTGHRCDLSASWIRLYPKREEEMRPVLDMLESWGVRTYGLTSYNIDEEQLSGEQIKDGWTVSIGNPGREANPHPPVPCHILFTFCTVDERGNMHVCAFDHGANTPRFAVGNLLDEGVTFMDLWHHERYRAFRRAHLQSWERQSMDPALNTPCRACLTPPAGQSGLLPGQPLFLDHDPSVEVSEEPAKFGIPIRMVTKK